MRKTKLSVQTMKICFELEALSSGEMPYYSASIFRGMWGKEIFQRSCTQNEKNCDVCELIKDCWYGKIFEPTSEAFAPHFRHLMKKITPPFVVEAPFFYTELWQVGEKKDLTVVLFGEDVDMFLVITETLMSMGKTGVGKDRIPFVIKRISQLLQDGTSIILFDKDTFNIENASFLTNEWEEPHQLVTSLLVHIETPMRLVHKGDLVKHLNIDSFATNVVRTCERVIGLYGAHTSFFEPKVLLEQITSTIKLETIDIKWVDWNRYSARQKKELKLGGLVGSFYLQGNLTFFLPYLLCACYSHIGKQSVFGLGKCVVYKKLL